MSGTQDVEPVVLDEVFDVLSHRSRRRILTRLSDHAPSDEDELDPKALVTEGEDFDMATSTLFHSHLPKLDEAGFIDWDRERHVVRRGPRFDEIEPLIDLMVSHQDELPAGWL